VGKSSIVNALMTDAQREESPLLVSPIAGTTRDSTDTEVTYHGKPFILVDTAGLKRRPHAVGDIERLSMMRTVTSIEGSDVVVLVLDALLPISQQDKKIAAMAVESGKGLVILVNKIDQVKGEARKSRLHEVSVLLSFCKFAKIIPVSAVTREGLLKLFDTVEAVQRSRTLRVPSRALRRWFDDTVHGQPLGELARCKHLTQADQVPPTFVFFVKQPKRVKTSDLRYLERKLRETFGFDGVPIRMVTKSSEQEE
jgi:GTP-binding protein